MEKALEQDSSFKFDRDVLPDEFKGLLERERRVLDVQGSDFQQLLDGTKTTIQQQLKELYGL